MNIDSLGPETVEDYYKKGIIRNVADLYDIKMQDIDGSMGTRAKSAKKIIDAIKNTANVPFERVVFAIGIRFVGETTAKLLARKFKSMDALENANLQQLLEVEGVGTVIANSVIDFFQSEENREIIRRLEHHGVKMKLEIEDTLKQTEILKGMSIVISGVFTKHSRDEYKELIERNGGK
ncbi:MAG: NAD-dependent DNA ligase LigA, partial [Clostridia bacterium]|nr:NAD-dependent DNA ligase LigA [Clostridia bacterium]